MFLTKEDRAILKVVDRLKKKESDVFWLFVGGMTPKEISEGLEDMNYSHVSSAMARVRAKFDCTDSQQLLCTVLQTIIRKECEEF